MLLAACRNTSDEICLKPEAEELLLAGDKILRGKNVSNEPKQTNCIQSSGKNAQAIAANATRAGN